MWNSHEVQSSFDELQGNYDKFMDKFILSVNLPDFQSQSID